MASTQGLLVFRRTSTARVIAAAAATLQCRSVAHTHVCCWLFLLATTSGPVYPALLCIQKLNHTPSDPPAPPPCPLPASPSLS